MDSRSIYSSVAKIYDACLEANGYAESVRNAVEHLHRLINNDDMPVCPKTAIDAGCGTGLVTIPLLEFFPEIEIRAVDLNDSMLERLEAKLGARGTEYGSAGAGTRVKIMRSNIELPLPAVRDEEADIVITAGVLEYTDPGVTVKNIARYLRPGGWHLDLRLKADIVGKLIGRALGFTPLQDDHYFPVFESAGLRFVERLPFGRSPLNVSSLKEGNYFRKTAP